MFRPKLLDTLKSYTRQQFFSDSMAGLIVGIVALPLAIAFAIASGLTPERGLYTAIVAGLVISILGGSRVQIGGPTGAFVVIVYGIVERFGVEGLLIATLLAGVLLIIMGLARLGSFIKFIPYPVVIGFTAGIAVIIFSSQVNDLLGLGIHDLPGDFVEKWVMLIRNLGNARLPELAIGLGTILVAALWPRISTRLPGPFVAIILSAAAAAFWQLPVETIGSRFGEIPHGLPLPSLPHLDWTIIKELFQPALTIALLGGIEALLSAVVADGMIGGRHRSNMELIAQGAANVVSPLFGGMPATGAIARTATNVKNGGRTPVAGIIHAFVLLGILLAFGRWAALIPLSALAGIMIVVAYHMSEWRSFASALRGARSDSLVLLVTFGLTVMLDLTIAIEVGLGLAGIMFMRRMAYVSNVSAIKSELESDGEADVAPEGPPENPEVRIYEVTGPLFFGAAYKFKELLSVVDKAPRIIILRMRNVPMIDSTGLRMLEDVNSSLRRQGCCVILAEIQPGCLAALRQGGLLERIGPDNVHDSMDGAYTRAVTVLLETEPRRP